MLDTAFTFSDIHLPGKAEPVGQLIERAQHHIARMADLVGVADTDIAGALTIGRAALLVVLGEDRRPIASSLLFHDRNDHSAFRTLYAVMVADSPEYSFRDLAERAENAAKSDEQPGPFQFLDITATGAIGLEGYSIRESEPGRVVVGKLALAI